MKTLIIEKDDTFDNYYTVRSGNKFVSGLTWDEMLGQIAYITCPRGEGWTDESLFGMGTQAEHDEQERKLKQALSKARMAGYNE